jgi:hypothetical protein
MSDEETLEWLQAKPETKERKSFLTEREKRAIMMHAESIQKTEPSGTRNKEFDGIDKTCLSYWFPLLAEAGIPVPETIIVKTNVNLMALFDGLIPEGYQEFITELRGAVDHMMQGSPGAVFLRTGQTSGKHEWERTCYLTDATKLEAHVSAITEFSAIADFFGLRTDVWAVREMLPVNRLAICERYSGMPFVREYRFFVDGPKIEAVFPYWPKESLKQGKPGDPNWADRWQEVYDYYPSDTVIALASKAGAALGGKFSVDVLDTERGWYVTDCAEAYKSYRWSERDGIVPWEQE